MGGAREMVTGGSHFVVSARPLAFTAESRTDGAKGAPAAKSLSTV